MRRLIPLVLLAVLLQGCRTTGKVDSTRSTASRARVLVGPVIIRDLRYNPYMSENLKSAILYHLEKKGFDALTYEKPRQAPPEAGRKADPTADLLPKQLAAAAGEMRGMEISTGRDALNLLDREAVVQALQRDQGVYFIQGFVARDEAGTLLEVEESYLVILDVFGNTGKKIGAISFTVKDNSLTDSTFLTFVAQRIANAFEEKLAGQNAAWQEPGCVRLKVMEWFGL